MRTVVVGGYGNFGARICRALSSDPTFDVIAAGRSPASRQIGAQVELAKLDLESPDFADSLKSLAPDLVIHCAGPFQSQDYRVAEATLFANAHYIDLADSRAFVTRFAIALDARARAAGLFMTTGASSVPALSSAVIDHLQTRLGQIEEIQLAIAPGQRAARGTATIAGVFSYAGKPFKWMRGGMWCDAWGWQELIRLRFAGLGVRWAAACDIPDLELFPKRYPDAKTIQFHAALELGILHAALWTAAALRRGGVPLELARAAPLLDRAASLFDVFGGDRGGMLVRLKGVRKDGTRGSLAWHLTADAGDGPEIPSMAAILIARKLAHGTLTTSGAFPCIGFLTLSEFEPEFARWRISTSIEENTA